MNKDTRSRLIDIFNKIDSSENRGLNYNSRIMIIDLMNLFIRSYCVSTITNDNGEHVGGTLGTLLSLSNIIKKFKPTRVIACLDGNKGSQYRKEIYPEYKANRHKTQNYNREFDYESLEIEQKIMSIQLSKLLEYLEFFPIKVISEDHIEADDMIAIINNIYKDSKRIIVSTDKDFLQLCSDNVQVYSPVKKILYDKDKVYEMFSVIPENLVYYRAIIGDDSDNISGIKGIGKKTIMKKLNVLTEKRELSKTDIINSAKENDLNKLIDNIDILDRNIKLMQLKNVDFISESLINKIKNQVECPVNRLIKYKFQKTLIQDRVLSFVSNLNMWLNLSFGQLDSYALKCSQNV